MRRKHHDEHVNHEAWAIPYADLMTLLLAFFVVMYAVSVVNEGKYRVASEALAEAFNGSNAVLVRDAASKRPPKSPDSSRPLPAAAASSASVSPSDDLQRIEDLVRKALKPLIDRKLVVVRGGPDRLEIEIRTDVLFPSGVASLSTPAQAVLSSMAGILAPFGNALRIEGFTDNVPIASPAFPSNWELSAARAASVARLFAEHGIDPDRMGIVGWGEVRPIADNGTSEGRNQNRRVLVVVMGGREPPAQRPSQDLQHLAAERSSPLLARTATAAAAPAPIPAAAGSTGVLTAQAADQAVAEPPAPAPTLAVVRPGADPKLAAPAAQSKPTAVQGGRPAPVRGRADLPPSGRLR
jgi:chemotaxis protein MotB